MPTPRITGHHGHTGIMSTPYRAAGTPSSVPTPRCRAQWKHRTQSGQRHVHTGPWTGPAPGPHRKASRAGPGEQREGRCTWKLGSQGHPKSQGLAAPLRTARAVPGAGGPAEAVKAAPSRAPSPGERGPSSAWVLGGRLPSLDYRCRTTSCYSERALRTQSSVRAGPEAWPRGEGQPGGRRSRDTPASQPQQASRGLALGLLPLRARRRQGSAGGTPQARPAAHKAPRAETASDGHTRSAPREASASRAPHGPAPRPAPRPSHRSAPGRAAPPPPGLGAGLRLPPRRLREPGLPLAPPPSSPAPRPGPLPPRPPPRRRPAARRPRRPRPGVSPARASGRHVYSRSTAARAPGGKGRRCRAAGGGAGRGPAAARTYGVSTPSGGPGAGREAGAAAGQSASCEARAAPKRPPPRRPPPDFIVRPAAPCALEARLPPEGRRRARPHPPSLRPAVPAYSPGAAHAPRGRTRGGDVRAGARARTGAQSPGPHCSARPRCGPPPHAAGAAPALEESGCSR